MAQCLFCGEVEECRTDKYEYSQRSRACLLGPTIDETIIYLICSISKNLAYWLNLFHREPPEEKRESSLNDSNRRSEERKHRMHRKRHHRSSDCAMRRTSDSMSHSSEESRRHKVSYHHSPSVYRVDEQEYRKHGLINHDRTKKCHKKDRNK